VRFVSQPPPHHDQAPGQSAPADGGPAAAGGPASDALARQGRFSPIERLLVTIAAVAVVVLFMRLVAGIIVPILLALVITMAVTPFLSWLIRHHLPAWLAWLITVMLTTAAVVFVFVLAGVGAARLIGELQGNSGSLSTHLAHAVAQLNSAGIHVSGLTKGDNALLSAQHIINVAVHLLRATSEILGGVALTLLIVFFMLAEATTLQLKFAMTPPNVSLTLQRLELFTRDMRSFVQATAVLGLVNGAAAALFLWLLGVHFPVLWGVFAFLMTFIPNLGFFIAVLPPAFLALLASGWKQALLVFLGYLVIYAITGSMRSGRFVGRRLNLSPLVILLSIILWGWVLGLMGGLLAVPMTLLVRRLFVEAYDESRWITDLLGRPSKVEQAAQPGQSPHT
jgi:AI-2 transport protein TqsA